MNVSMNITILISWGRRRRVEGKVPYLKVEQFLVWER